ncbi:MAG: response regulator [Nitrososphaera sp.]|nr:response regulator [Nitrososphaera sp.]
MKILIAEDEPLIAQQYQVILQARGHDVRIIDNGLDFLEAYRTALGEANKQRRSFDKIPFDVVILDYRMPKKNGLETARETIKLCPDQRIIFASAFVRETLREATKGLHQVVELLQKPFDLSYLVEVVEDTDVYNQLVKLNDKVKQLEARNPTHAELVELSRSLRDALRSAASVRLSHAELRDLLESMKRLRATLYEAD